LIELETFKFMSRCRV